SLRALLLLLTACLAVSTNPVPDNIPVQEDLDGRRAEETRASMGTHLEEARASRCPHPSHRAWLFIYGKWFNVALGSTCRWLQRFMGQKTMRTEVLTVGDKEGTISMTGTHWRRGVCEEYSGVYEMTDTNGKFLYHRTNAPARWNSTMETYVVYTNYDEYGITVTKKFSHRHGTTITAKLYGRQPELQESRYEEFRQVARDLGIPNDSIFTLANRGECVPGELEAASTQHSRARRAVLPEKDEGSGAGQPVNDFTKKEDSCQLERAAGPCLGLMNRYFYNGTSMACETFQYGGCLGNGNNFASEKECLQTCRTVAACNLPIVTGPCKTSSKLWAFDAAQGKCVLFTYGGCQGNGNKFYSEKECKEYCGVPGEGRRLAGQPAGPRDCGDPGGRGRRWGLERWVLGPDR
ncbi:Protein AMBP, partial [Galemys pyrenaicus]